MARSAAGRRLGAAVLTLAACDSPTVPPSSPSYDPRYVAGNGARLAYHWPLGKTIDIHVDPRGAPTGLDLARAVRGGAAAWRAVVFYREFDVRLVGDPATADVIFRFDAAPPLLLAECPAAHMLASAAGVTAACPDELRGVFLPFTLLDGRPSRAKFEVTITSDTRVIPNGGRLLSIVGHELGHVLGIGSHSPNNLDLMHPSPGQQSPGPGDARTLRYLLHQPADLRP
jgi:hypothetical protein